MEMERRPDEDEDDAFDDGTRAMTYAPDAEEDVEMQTSARKAERSSKQQATALRVQNWDADEAMESAEYAARVVERKTLGGQEGDKKVEDGGASPDEDDMAAWSDAEPFGASDDEEDEEEEEEDEKQADEEDDDAETLIRGFEEEDAAPLMQTKDRAQLLEKASHVRHQKLVWERCLEMQIYTKRLLATVKEACGQGEGKLETASCSEEQRSALSTTLLECLESIATLQNSLCNSTELQGRPAEEASKKRKRSTHDMWEDIASTNEAILPQYDTILTANTQLLDARDGKVSSAKKFKAVNQSILSQVDAVLADPQRVKHKAHAPLDLDGDNGHTSAEDDSTEALDELMYDDSDFYQQLLKEFLEHGANSGQDALLVRRRHRKKKVVNRKASKGRVLRYTVLPKLENFMFPDPYPEASIDVDELFRSLFGQLRSA